jgi:hypothetical protein
MGHSSKDLKGELLYTTARHSPTAFMVLTASSPPNCMLCTGLFCSFAANQDVTILSVQTLVSVLQYLSHYSADHPIVAEILLQVSNPHTSGQYGVLLGTLTLAYLAARLPMWQPEGRPYTDFSFLVELSAPAFALASVTLFYHGKLNRTMLMATNCVW